jgi:hypothetical protein
MPERSGVLSSAKAISWKREVLLGFVVALAGLLYFSQHCDDSPFQGDAADYIGAVEGGMSTLYLDSGSVGLWGALALARQPERRAPLGSLILHHFVDQDDAAASRHFHVAPGFYPNVLASSWGADNRAQRPVAAAVAAAAAGIMFLGLRLAGVHLLLALVSAFLAVLSPTVVVTSTDISPHSSFLAVMLAAAFSLARYLETGREVWIFTAAAAFAATVATLELSIVTAAAFAVVLVWNYRHQVAPKLREFRVSVLIFLSILLVLWPGGVIRGGYVLSYGAYIYLALFRRQAWYGDFSLGRALIRGCQGSPFMILVLTLVVFATLSLAVRRKLDPYTCVFGWLTLAFLSQGMLNNFRNSTYAAHFMVLVWILMAIAAQRWLDSTAGVRHREVLAAVGMVLVLAVISVF